MFGQNVMGTIELDWEEIQLPNELDYYNVFKQRNELCFKEEKININLIDVHGKICFSQKWNIRNNGEKQVLKIDLKNQIKGVYFIDFQSIKSRTIKKVIIN